MSTTSVTHDADLVREADRIARTTFVRITRMRDLMRCLLSAEDYIRWENSDDPAADALGYACWHAFCDARKD